MSLFKRKVKAEDLGRVLVKNSVPHALKFFKEENGRAPKPIRVTDVDLMNIGTGMCVYFLSSGFDESKKDDMKKLQRAFSGMRRELRELGGKPDDAHYWWQAFADGESFYQRAEPLSVAVKIVWERLFPDRRATEHPAIKALAYFLQLESELIHKVKVV